MRKHIFFGIYDGRTRTPNPRVLCLAEWTQRIPESYKPGAFRIINEVEDFLFRQAAYIKSDTGFIDAFIHLFKSHINLSIHVGEFTESGWR